MRDVDVQSAVRANVLRSIVLVAGFPFVLPSILFLIAIPIAQRDRLAVAGQVFWVALATMVVISVVWLPIGYVANQWVIDRATGARLVSRAELSRVWLLLERLCARAALRVPALRLIETDALNAYASGLREGQYSVTVTRGLIDALEDDELEAVLAHELTHIRNHDVQLLVIANVLVGTVPLIHDVVMKVYWGLIMGILTFYRAVATLMPIAGVRLLIDLTYGGVYWLGRIGAYAIGLLATLCSLVLHFALSREREFMADAGAVELTGNPSALVSALRKISGTATLDTAVASVRAMCFENAAFGWFGIFATHPPIERRIAEVERIAEALRQGTREDPPQMMPVRADADALDQGQVDRVTLDRYRALVLGAGAERLDPIERQHLYRRMRQALERAPEVNPSLTHAQIALARAGLEAAIEEVEAAMGGRSGR